MKAYAALVLLAFMAYCHAADKNYNDLCTKDDKCLGDTTCIKKHSSCTSGRCLCKSGYSQKSSNTCQKMKKVGESCSSNSVCMGGTCSSSKCTCSTGTVANSDKTGCGRYVGMTCTDASSCGTNMECPSSKKCACKSAYKEVNQMCMGYYLDESCAGGKTCQYGTCQSDKCACTNSLVAYLQTQCINSAATKDVKKGEACDEAGTATSKYCGKGLYCGTCDNDTKKICLSGAPAMKASALAAVVAATLAFIHL